MRSNVEKDAASVSPVPGTTSVTVARDSSTLRFNTPMPEFKLPNIIDSPRYDADRSKPLGKGAWGEVYEGNDKAFGTKVAIKVLAPIDLAQAQAEYRQLSPMDVMRKEAAELAACSHVVPRKFEIDSVGTPFIVMPVYKRGTLADRLGETRPNRRYAGSGLHEKEVYSTLTDLAKGLSEVHSVLKRAHGDLKPDNVLITEQDEAHINDLGSSTEVAYARRTAPRDNIGHLYTRAPECFREGSAPTTQSDVWGFGSLAYRMFTGKYIFEDELNNSVDPRLFFEQIGENAGNRIVKDKIKKNIPRQFRKLLNDCLRMESYKRLYDGSSVASRLQHTIDNLGFWGDVKRHAKHVLIGAISSGVLGMAIYGAATHEPKELKMPEVVLKGETIVGNPVTDERITFEQEKIPFSKPLLNLVAAGGEDYDLIKHATDNATVAFIASRYMRAAMEERCLQPNDEQTAIYATYRMHGGQPGLAGAYAGMIDSHIAIPTKCIEYALNHTKTPEGRVDLEDMCVVARLGTAKWNAARRAAGSFDYAKYADAKGKDGKFIISRSDKDLIDKWRGYLNSH